MDLFVKGFNSTNGSIRSRSAALEKRSCASFNSTNGSIRRGFVAALAAAPHGFNSTNGSIRRKAVLFEKYSLPEFQFHEWFD